VTYKDVTWKIELSKEETYSRLPWIWISVVMDVSMCGHQT